jgi:hypothetical protein
MACTALFLLNVGVAQGAERKLSVPDEFSLNVPIENSLIGV